MPIWCPRCGAMLANGSEVCSRCGKKLGSTPADDADLSSKEIWNLTLYVLRIVLIPTILVLFIGILCYLVYFR